MDNEERIILRSDDSFDHYLTLAPLTDSFLVTSGSVQVFIAPVKKEKKDLGIKALKKII